jgi:hypothetical protein
MIYFPYKKVNYDSFSTKKAKPTLAKRQGMTHFPDKKASYN